MGTTLALFAFVLGGFLLLVAIAGGSFAAEELRVPKVGRAVRALSLLLGIVVIGLGLSLGTDPLDSPPAVSSPAAASPQVADPSAASAPSPG